MGQSSTTSLPNMIKFVVLSCCLAVCASLPNYAKEVPSVPGISYEKHEKHAGMPYNYAWEVKDAEAGLNYGQNENSDGSVVTGEYRVLLPDGRTQVVTYKADHNSGYVAEVTYEGEAIPYVAPAKPAYPAQK